MVNILIAHDDPGVRSSIRTEFQRENYGVKEVADGIEAIALLTGRPDGFTVRQLENPTKYHGIITRDDLPIMSGVRMAKELARQGITLPMIVYERHQIPGSKLNFLESGYKGEMQFFSPPIYHPTLSKTMELMIERSEKLRQCMEK